MTDNKYTDPHIRIAIFKEEVERLERIVEARNKECNRLTTTVKELRHVIVGKNDALTTIAVEWKSCAHAELIKIAQEAIEKD